MKPVLSPREILETICAIEVDLTGTIVRTMVLDPGTRVHVAHSAENGLVGILAAGRSLLVVSTALSARSRPATPGKQ